MSSDRRRPYRARWVLAACLAAVGGLSACALDQADPHVALTYRLTKDCPAPPSHRPTVTADQLNKIVADSDLPAWQAGDIGTSARLSDGRLVWVFDDTLRKDGYQPQLVANSIVITSGDCAAQLMTSEDGPVIPDASQQEVLWPTSVAVLRDDPKVAKGTDVLVVPCARTVRGDSGGTLDFTFYGTSAAVLTVPPGGVPILEDVYEVTPDSQDEHQIQWGQATTVHGPWFYVYGTRAKGSELGRELYVARVPVDDPRNRSRWGFWDGHQWQSSPDRASPVIGTDPGVSQTLSVHVDHGTYVVTSKRGGDLGDFVYTWDSPHPTGPWHPNQALEAPAGFDTGLYQYAPLAHPEIPVAPGHLLVSVSQNAADLDVVLQDPEKGRPLFAEVEDPVH